MNNTSEPSAPSAPLGRRFAAIFYDSLLVIALLFIATAIITPLLPHDMESHRHRTWVTLYLASLVFLFFAWFWTHGGQTLGMRAWRLQLCMEDGAPISWLTALMRFCYSLPAWGVFIFGVIDSSTRLVWPESMRWLQEIAGGYLIYIGLAWLIMDNWPNNWRERLTHTKVVWLTRK